MIVPNWDLLHSTSLTKALFNRSTLGIEVFDRTGLCVLTNDTFLGMCGARRQDEVSGRHNILRDGLDSDGRAIEAVRRAFGGEEAECPVFSCEPLVPEREPAPVEDGAHAGQGVASWLTARFVPLCNREDQVEHVLGMYRDLTQEHAAEAEVLRSARELVLLNDVIAHDITNFHHVIRGYLDLLIQEKVGVLNDEQRRFVRKCIHQIDRATSLTDNVKDLSRLRGISESDFELIDLGEMIAEAVTEVCEQFASRAPTITFTRTPGQMVRAVPLLSSVFRNLLVNAVRHNTAPVPEIEVSVSEGSGDQAGFWLVAVEDNGGGVPAEMRETIFDRFKSTTKTRGTEKAPGFGLAIVDALARRHGGRIWLEDRSPETTSGGSRFIVQLPRET